MAQFDVNQAIAGCKDKTYRDVLPLLENLIYGASHAKAFSTESLATAMHRIASTGASDPSVIGEVLNDRRFQALIHEVENRLRILPQEFNNQSLANVVWGAGKLRLSQRPELFLAVEREVLNISRRSLSAFTPQQLAAIAWGFVAAEMTAPRLFYAIQNEARSQPVLDDLLQKAGLLQHLRQRGTLAAGLPVGLNGGWSQGMAPSQGAATSQYLPHGMQGNGGGFPVLGSAPPSRPPQHPTINYGGSLQGGVLPTPSAAQVQYLSQIHPSLASFSTQVHQPPVQQGSVHSPRLIHGVHSAQTLANPTVQHHSVPGTGASASNAAPQPRYCDVSNRPDVAMAAEEHKREMERKQREVLGDADSEWSCPLCIEQMDDTDISFLPCPCGYQICRLCYHRIVKTETGTCPACRAEYKEENIQKKTIPDKKKKEGEVDPGWETGVGKKKANKEKKPAVPTYSAFPVKVRELLLRCHEIGHVVRGELDDRVLEDLKALPERGAVAVLNEFIKKDMSRIRNKCAFLHRIIQRVQQEEAQPDKCGLERCPAAAPTNPASAQFPLPPQRSRAVSDVGCAPKNGVAVSASLGVNGYQQTKGMGGGWAEKENGGGQVYGCNGVMGGAIEMNGDAHRASGELITPDYGAPRRTIDEYLQSRPSLQLPGAYRQVNTGAGDSLKYRESAANGISTAQQQLHALKLSTKETLSPAAGAAAGSRLLAMLQSSSQPAGGQPQFSSDWKQEKPPLFARAGGNGGRECGTGAFRSTCSGSEEQDLLAMIARGDSSHGRCGQCGLHKFGDIDTSDGNFYCEDCWKAFESSRNEGSMGPMVKL